MKHILVLGGTGFVGAHVCEKLVRAGFRVSVPTRRAVNARKVQHLPGLTVLECNVHDEAALTKAMAGADAVVNLVAILHGTPEAFDRVHRQLPEKIARACRAKGVRHLVHISALGTDHRAPQNCPSNYLRSKGRGEAALMQILGWPAAAAQPAPTFLFFAGSETNGGGIRVLDAHLPWSDSTIYWDTAGCCDSGRQRISVGEPNAAKWRGQWNHYVLQKQGDRKEIWQNGTLLHSGTNTDAMMNLRSFYIGASNSSGTSGYQGLIDDFAVWDSGLEPAQIAALIESAGVAKARLPFGQMLTLAVLAGAFIGFGGAAYLMVMTGVEPTGPAKLLGGVVFSLGLILCIVGGAELFTGNALMVMAAVPKAARNFSASAASRARAAPRCWTWTTAPARTRRATPRRGASASPATPILPPAPPWFSMMICWPSAAMRPCTSVKSAGRVCVTLCGSAPKPRPRTAAFVLVAATEAARWRNSPALPSRASFSIRMAARVSDSSGVRFVRSVEMSVSAPPAPAA